MPTIKALSILVGAILVAVGLGTIFTRVYPRVEISVGLILLSALVGLSLVLAVYGVWQVIWRKKT
jgi:hypothetical protein